MEDSAQQIMDSFRRIIQALRKASRESEDKVGLRAGQVFVLLQLKKYEPLSLNELAFHTCSHQSTISVVVDTLVKQNYIHRVADPADRRRMILRLTKKGRLVMKQKRRMIQERFIDSLYEMPKDQRKLLAQLLAKFLANAGVDSKQTSLFFENDSKRKKRFSKKHSSKP